jgi:cation transport ATPase
MGIDVVMMTGDAPWRTRWRPARDRHRTGGSVAQDKAVNIERLQQQQACGDGRRRRERCARAGHANVGIAIGAGTDVAVEAE